MRVFEAPEDTRRAILAKYRQSLEKNDRSEMKAFDKAIERGTVRGSGLYHALNDPVRTLLALNAISNDDDGIASFDLEGVTEVAIEWLCNQFVPLETFGSYDDEESLIYPEDLPRALKTWGWYLKNRTDNKVQNQFITMFPQQIANGASPKNPLSWTCYQMEDVMDALTPESMGTERNQRWRPEDLGWGEDDAVVVHDEDGWMIIKVLGAKAAADYGRGTRWCTSNEGTARSYLDKNPLFVVFHNGRKFLQSHYDDGELMIMDLRDREIEELDRELGIPLGNAMFGEIRDEILRLMETDIDAQIAIGKAKAESTYENTLKRLERSVANYYQMQTENENLSRFMDRIIPKRVIVENRTKQEDAKQRYIRNLSDLDPEKLRQKNDERISEQLQSLAGASNTITQNPQLIPAECLESTDVEEPILKDLIDRYRKTLDLSKLSYGWWQGYQERKVIFYLLRQANRLQYQSPELDSLFIYFMKTFVQNADHDDAEYFTNLWPILLNYGDLIPEGDTETREIVRSTAKGLYDYIYIEKDLFEDMEVQPSRPRQSYMLSLKDTTGGLDQLILQLSMIPTQTDGKWEDFHKNVSRIAQSLDDLDDDQLSLFRPIAPYLKSISLAMSKTIVQIDNKGPDFKYSIAYDSRWYGVNFRDELSNWFDAVKRSRTNPVVATVKLSKMTLNGPDYDDDYCWEQQVFIEWPESLDEQWDWSYDWDSEWFKNPSQITEQDAIEMIKAQSWWRTTTLTIESLNNPSLPFSNTWSRIAPPFAYYYLLLMLKRRFGDDCLDVLLGQQPSDLISRIGAIPWLDIGSHAASESPDPIPLSVFASFEDLRLRSSDELPSGYLLVANGKGKGSLLWDNFTDYIDRIQPPKPRPKTWYGYAFGRPMQYYPDDFPDLSTEVFEILNAEGELSDTTAMNIFRGYFVEPLIPIEDRTVRQINDKGFARPPATLGYVCYTCKRPIEYDVQQRRWLKPVGSEGRDVWANSRNNCENRGIEHILAVMPTSSTNEYAPVRAQSLWCSVCTGVRANPSGMDWPTTDYSRNRSNGGRQCTCGYAKANDALYE